jgi:DNA-binding NtrC family response regulator
MNKNINILIVDDEFSVRDSLFKWFREDGYSVDTAENAVVALKKIQDSKWDLILLDIKMPGMDGMELQKRIKEIDPGIIVIMITAFAAVDTAVQALKVGAYDYVTKPVDPDYLSHIVNNALREKQLSIENLQLRESISEFSKFDEIVGESQGMKNVFDLIGTVAKTDTTVLIRGESGTGKELIARAIHSNSARRYFPFIPVNCGGLPEGILESELFGHERGAFTGAQYRRKGKFEMADGGTIFLDEIGNVSAKTQMDLLRIIETKKFTRVGGNEEIGSDFRIISATNADLESAVKAGTFREDLYYRLNVFSIFLPPLRERRSDIPILAQHFLKKYSTSMSKPMESFSSEAMDVLVKYNWPGNIRELENAIERAMVVGKPPYVKPEDLPFQLGDVKKAPATESLAEIEKSHIIFILEKSGWNITRSAETLGIDRVTLYNKIEKYGLRK